MYAKYDLFRVILARLLELLLPTLYNNLKVTRLNVTRKISEFSASRVSFLRKRINDER